jgi:hypothetical protein
VGEVEHAGSFDEAAMPRGRDRHASRPVVTLSLQCSSASGRKAQGAKKRFERPSLSDAVAVFLPGAALRLFAIHAQ